MPWIEIIAYAEASGRLRQLYDRIKGPGDVVDDIMMAHSLRPHSMEGHMALYTAALHHGANRVPKWFLETLGVWVSRLNRCAYCVAHHSAGLARLLGDNARHAAIVGALDSGEIETGPFTEREQRALRYTEALTRDPAAPPAAAASTAPGTPANLLFERVELKPRAPGSPTAVRRAGSVGEGDGPPGSVFFGPDRRRVRAAGKAGACPAGARPGQ